MIACPGDSMQWAERLCALLPPGFAWEAADTRDTIMNRRVRSIAALFQRLHEDACVMPREFICDTATDWSLPYWHADYGLPDACGINDLCTKVYFDGGARCEDFVELGVLLDMDICCEVVPVEMQCGECWEMGIEQMAPQPEWLDGGTELGFVGLGFCPVPTGIGSPLGQAVLNVSGEDCYVAGYHEGESSEDIEPPCLVEVSFGRWFPPSTGEFITGCASPWRLDYTGNSYTLKLGIKGSSAILSDPSFAQMGCMEMGCSELCSPPAAELFCFAETIAHGHLNVVPFYC